MVEWFEELRGREGASAGSICRYVVSMNQCGRGQTVNCRDDEWEDGNCLVAILRDEVALL